MIVKKNLQAELEFMRELFNKNLPVGNNKKQIEEYFNRLEELIYNTDEPEHIVREQFPPADPAVCGEREYWYYSSDYFKKLASQPKPITGEQDVVDSKDREVVSSDQNQSTTTQDMEYIQKCPETSDLGNTHSVSNDISGQLDTDNTGGVLECKTSGS